MSHKGSRWFRWQRGQALAEYWPTIPIGIAIMLSASVLTGFVTRSFEKTIQGFESSGLDCPVGTSAEEEGPSTADMGGPKVEFSGSNMTRRPTSLRRA